MPDHPLVTRGKQRSRSIEPSAAAAIRYWPICPQGHGMTYLHSGKRGQWVCRPCRTARQKERAEIGRVTTPAGPIKHMNEYVRLCFFCDTDQGTLYVEPHPFGRGYAVYLCASCKRTAERCVG